MLLHKNSPKYRELLWLACVNDAGVVVCNLCKLPVEAGDAWDESHVGAPKALGGNTVGVAHRRCNQRDNNEVVTPMVAKTKRMKRKHTGIVAPGLGRNPMPCGRRSRFKKKMDGSVVLRNPAIKPESLA